MAELKHRELFGPNHWDDTYYESLVGVLETLDPKPRLGLEIGFCWGMSAKAFLEVTQGKLLSLDRDDQMRKVLEFSERYGDRFKIMYGDSSTIMRQLKIKFDWIYVDGDHEYAGVKKDLESAWPLLTEKGVMVCDDYGNPCGVKEAVDEFVAAHHLTMKPVPLSPSRAVILCNP